MGGGGVLCLRLRLLLVIVALEMRPTPVAEDSLKGGSCLKPAALEVRCVNAFTNICIRGLRLSMDQVK
jgi:hypothetical protein